MRGLWTSSWRPMSARATTPAGCCAQLQVRGRSHIKPTTRLLHQVPIRTFTEWKDATVGQMGAGTATTQVNSRRSGRPRWW